MVLIINFRNFANLSVDRVIRAALALTLWLWLFPAHSFKYYIKVGRGEFECWFIVLIPLSASLHQFLSICFSLFVFFHPGLVALQR